MNTHNILCWHQSLSIIVLINHVLSVSADGYICMSFTELQTITLSHLISGIDENMSAATSSGGTATDITGYTEWVSLTTPAITIGWDWQMGADHNGIQLRKISGPRSNVMFKDKNGQDIGPEKTEIMLAGLIDGLDWIDTVRSYIEHRYAL